MWFSKLRALAHVHALPLIGGALFGYGVYSLQVAGIVSVKIALLSNQEALDAVCRVSQLCLQASDGPAVVSSLAVATTLALAFDRLYVAESPKHAWLLKAEDVAEKSIGH